MRLRNVELASQLKTNANYEFENTGPQFNVEFIPQFATQLITDHCSNNCLLMYVKIADDVLG